MATVYVSNACQSICANSESNTPNTQVHVECENATKNAKNRVKTLLLQDGVDMIKVLDIPL